MATKKVMDATAAILPEKEGGAMIEPTVRVYLPVIEDQDNNVEIEQTETVVINGNATLIRRGEYVDVKVPVFLQLKQRYPNI